MLAAAVVVAVLQQLLIRALVALVVEARAAIPQQAQPEPQTLAAVAEAVRLTELFSEVGLAALGSSFSLFPLAIILA
jgi:hypothetical protein